MNLGLIAKEITNSVSANQMFLSFYNENYSKQYNHNRYALWRKENNNLSNMPINELNRHFQKLSQVIILFSACLWSILEAALI